MNIKKEIIILGILTLMFITVMILYYDYQKPIDNYNTIKINNKLNEKDDVGLYYDIEDPNKIYYRKLGELNFEELKDG